ncbi:MAG: hypothetical protein AAF721_17855 [Myxococcota bacterium]
MIWWIFAAVFIALAFRIGAVSRRRSLPAAPTAPALPDAAVALQQRLGGVDAAIEDIRALAALVPPSTVKACAAMALAATSGPAGAQTAHRSLEANRRAPHLTAQSVLANADVGDDAGGPGAARFVALLDALRSIEADDLRDLADAGLDPEKIIAAVSANTPPERWLEEVGARFDYWQQAVASLRTRRYG